LLARSKVFNPPTYSHTDTHTHVRPLPLQPFCKFHVHYICKFALFIYARQCAEHSEHRTYNMQHTNVQTHTCTPTHTQIHGKQANAHTRMGSVICSFVVVHNARVFCWTLLFNCNCILSWNNTPIVLYVLCVFVCACNVPLNKFIN